MDQAELNIFQILLEASLVVKLVLVFLILCSIYSWGIIFYKKLLLNKYNRRDKKFLMDYQALSNLDYIADQARKRSFSPLQYIFQESYEDIQVLVKDDERFSQRTLALFERAIKKRVYEVNEKLEQNLSALASIGSISPFVGLFGTVWGIVHSFKGIASTGATLETVAPGIAEALVATAIGLLVAIPAVLFYNFFLNSVGKIQNKSEAFIQDYLNQLEKKYWAMKWE